MGTGYLTAYTQANVEMKPCKQFFILFYQVLRNDQQSEYHELITCISMSKLSIMVPLKYLDFSKLGNQQISKSQMFVMSANKTKVTNRVQDNFKRELFGVSKDEHFQIKNS